MVELACLESMYTRKGIKGSNPFSSAFAKASADAVRKRVNWLCVEVRFYTYVLQSKKDFSFYIGECDDLDYRMSKHFDGWSKYTSTRGPWRLKYFEAYPTRKDSKKREREIKSKKSRQYIQRLIDNWLSG